jgi:hypothetical protein
MLWLVIITASASTLTAAPTLIIVQGAAGADEYASQFAQWRQRWEEAGKQGGADVRTLGAADLNTDRTDKDLLKEVLESLDKKSPEEVWLVLLGHGTFDGKFSRFNLRGPDVDADELAAWLKPLERPVAIVNCSSSSGPFLARLSGADRVIITATRSGNELNFSRFGGFLSQAIANPAADLDKDGQTSLLEAYLLASRQTQEWYKEEGRLATEHALIDDNADGLGTPAEWFSGIRAVKKAKDDAQVDGLRAAQWCLVRGERERKMPPELRARRDAIELQIASLRNEKKAMDEDVYYARLEVMLLELAKLAERIETGK